MELLPLLIISALLLVIVGWFARGIWKGARDVDALRKRGIPTSATVVKRATSSDADMQHTYYSLTVTYVVNGTTYQQSIGVQENAYNTSPEGSAIEIIFLPDNPKVVALKHLF